MSIGVKKKVIFIVVLAVVLVIGLGAAYWLNPKKVQIEGMPIQQKDLELICMTDTKEEAEKLAADYGIELINYSEKVAVFRTDKTYEEILEIGKSKGLTELSINNTLKAL